ncbi:hypothetical protein MTBPR1_100129 [Candidatus Terasakiella magnetica]|uniref:Uncharacterized protein n=1 Tax=Candidatus Terasakiella magnetica TaxID=1867952 RepID=A0A1C3RE24_9PROT|nr:hypothetical protein MTBPR1_100129 [Candidatus Terasakiella magnetica]
MRMQLATSSTRALIIFYNHTLFLLVSIETISNKTNRQEKFRTLLT